MFDVDFLQEPALKSHLVHLFDEGVFRRDVRQKVEALAEEKGWVCSQFDPEDPIVGGGLFGQSLIVVDLDSLAANTNGKGFLRQFEHSIQEDRSTHYFCFGTGVGSLSEMAEWDTLLSKATVLHEPRLSPASSMKLVKALAPKLLVDIDIVENRGEMDACIREWVRAEAPSLRRFRSMLEVGLVVGIRGRRFDPAAFTEAVCDPSVVPRADWIPLISNLLRLRGDADRRALLAALDRTIGTDRASSVTTLSAVRRATFDLVRVNEWANPGDGVSPAGWTPERWQACRMHKGVKLPTLLRWQLLLSRAELHLATGSLPAWESFLRQVQAVGQT